jgi:S-formylglutathione hydrolase FrmB
MQFTALDAHHHLTYINSNRRSRRLAVLPRADGVSLLLKQIILLLIFSTACSRTPTPSPPSRDITPTPPLHTPPRMSLTPDHKLLPNTTETQPPTLADRSAVCLDQKGIVLTEEIDVPFSNQSLPFRIYLPPCYAEDIHQDYPTLYMLHGIQADDSQWVEMGIVELSDALITSGQVEPFLIVMPWQKTGLDIELALVEELVPHIDDVYRSRTQPFWRAIGGLSRGGGWALRIGLKHPDVFGVIGLHSPATFYDAVYIALWVREIPKEIVPRIWIDIGKEDSLREATLNLILLFDELEVPHTSSLPEGGHSPTYWSAHLEEYLLWYTSQW